MFYDHEEVDAASSGLGRLQRNAPELLAADFAVLLEPTDGTVEGGCNGTIRFEATTVGEAAHSARAWMGSNAIHAAAPILARLAAYEPRTITVDGLDYRESLNAVKVNGGTAGNVRLTGREREILALINDLHTRLGSTIVIVTHDMHVAAQCQRTSLSSSQSYATRSTVPRDSPAGFAQPPRLNSSANCALGSANRLG